MPRTFSSTALNAFMARNSSEVALVLLHLQYTDSVPSTTHFYLVNNTEDVTGPDSQVYTAYPFALALPAEVDDRISYVELTVDNVDRALVEGVRTSVGPILVDISLVLASSPTVAEIALTDWKMTQVTYDGFAVTGQVYPTDLLNAKLPSERFTPTTAPGLF